CMQGLESPWTF
nr:immunoglobulin light chain junction region [Macaca mulatta]